MCIKNLLFSVIYFVIFISDIFLEASRFKENELDRPCSNLAKKCIIDYFAKHSDCKPVYNALPFNMHIIKNMELPFPHANLSFTWSDAYVTGLNDGVIREFYRNNKTQNLVFSVELSDVTIFSATCAMKVYLEGREPVEVRDPFVFTYKWMSFTMTVPFDIFGRIQWPKKDIYVYFTRLSCPMGYGSNYRKLESTMQPAFDKSIEDFYISVKEASVNLGTNYFPLYFNNNICDFE